MLCSTSSIPRPILTVYGNYRFGGPLLLDVAQELARSALALRIKKRPPEGAVLNVDQMAQISYELAFL